MSPINSRKATWLGFDAYDVEDHDYKTACWIYHKKPARRGYRQMWMEDGRQIPAHRAFYEHHVGLIPDGLQIDHLCGITSCVNPTHLEPVTARENNRRSRSPSALNALKTHCKRGHPFDEANTYRASNGQRVCRKCMAAHQRAYQVRKRERNAA